MAKIIHIRFYEELNEFIPSHKRKVTFDHHFSGSPDIKDIIESQGIPHTEIDLIIANGKSVGFGYKPQDDDMISVYPVFESLDIKPLIRLRPEPLRNTRFIADVHLGKLAGYLRLFGFDTLYDPGMDDKTIIETARLQKRIILTRDRGILKNSKVLHGVYVRSQIPKTQLLDIVHRLNLVEKFNPFARCMKCNGKINCVSKEKILPRLKPDTRKYYDEFFQCLHCNKIYWKGSHYVKMMKYLDQIKNSLSAFLNNQV